MERSPTRLKKHEAYCQLLGRPFARHLRVRSRGFCSGLPSVWSASVNAVSVSVINPRWLGNKVEASSKITTRFEDVITQALIFDAIRTPRGKGKADGALHSVKPVNLVAGLFTALQQRTALDTSQVDDAVLGLRDTRRRSRRRYCQDRCSGGGLGRLSVAGVQINRFCASGAEAEPRGHENTFRF